MGQGTKSYGRYATTKSLNIEIGSEEEVCGLSI